MSRKSSTSAGTAALRRATELSPFLRDCIVARPEIADAFLKQGAAEIKARTAEKAEIVPLGEAIARIMGRQEAGQGPTR